jgi:type I restriction enzyme, S subunit
MRLDQLADFNPPVKLKRGEVLPFIEMAALPTNNRYVTEIGKKEFTGSGARFEDGDTLFARITPCLENGKGAFVSGLGKGIGGFGSTEFIVLRAKENSDANFTYYLTRDPGFRKYAEGRMSGSSGRQRVSWDALVVREDYRYDGTAA